MTTTAHRAQILHDFIGRRVCAEIADLRLRHTESCDKLLVGAFADCDCDAEDHLDGLHQDYTSILAAANILLVIAIIDGDDWEVGDAHLALLALAEPYRNHAEYPRDESALL